MTAPQSSKDVIYVDVDDEITGVIDKVVSAHSKIIALVLPKRASVFQSIVNMKLLKRRADEAKKHLVLITSEAGLLPLAGATGIHVAKTLQSKPELPDVPAFNDASEAIDEDAPLSLSNEDFDSKKEGQRPVGDLAKGLSGSAMAEETIELDNSDLPDDGPSNPKSANLAALAADGGAGKSGGKGKNKKLKVPNFEKFRLKLIIAAVAIIVLVFGWIMATGVLAKATVTVTTNTSTVNSSLTPALDTTATSVDTSKQVVPAKVEQVQKTYTQQVAASGKQNNGTKATGGIAMTAQECAPNIGTPVPDVPAGTGVSVNGLTYVTQNDTTFSNRINGASGSCVNYSANVETTITAQNGGSQYNVDSSPSFKVAGRSELTGTGSASGGTDNIVTVVQQSDLDSAKQKAEAGIDKNAIQTQLQQTLQSDGDYAVTGSFASSSPAVTASNQVGDQTSNVTYTETITYTMFGAKKDDLHTLVVSAVNQQIDTSKQMVQDDGIGSANISVPNPGTATRVQLNMQVTSVVGPHLDINQLKQSILGKKSGDIQTTIKSNPGVQNVTVKFSPFWVNSVPKNANKITIILQKSS